MSELSAFGLNLKYLRESRNLAQRDIAIAIGVATGSLSNYENGRIPPLDVAEKIANYFDIELTEFLKLDEDKIPQSIIHKAEQRRFYKNEITGDKTGDKTGDIYIKSDEKGSARLERYINSDNNYHKEGNDYKIMALQKSLEDKERIIDMLNQRIVDKEELNKMLRMEVDRLKNELQGYKNG